MNVPFLGELPSQPLLGMKQVAYSKNAMWLQWSFTKQELAGEKYVAVTSAHQPQIWSFQTMRKACL